MAQKVDLGIPSLLCTDFAYSLRKFKAKLPYVVRRHIPPESVKYTFSGGYAKNPNFDESPELVLTVPPSSTQYYVVAYYDAYGNTIGSIGTRTTPSDAMTSYLLVGPTSPYAKKPTAKIHGYQYPVMASDTNVNWFLIRVLANTLIDAADPTSVPNVVSGVV